MVNQNKCPYKDDYDRCCFKNGYKTKKMVKCKQVNYKKCRLYLGHIEKFNGEKEK